MRYEVESNHIKIVVRAGGSLELALEEKKKIDIFTFFFFAYLVEPYTIVSVNVLELDR